MGRHCHQEIDFQALGRCHETCVLENDLSVVTNTSKSIRRLKHLSDALCV